MYTPSFSPPFLRKIHFSCIYNYLVYLCAKFKIVSDRYAQDSLIPWIGKTGKFLSIFLNHRLQELGVPLTSKQWIILRILHHKDGLPQNELAIITDRDKASIVRLINNMEKNLLLVRMQDKADKRINRIYLSDRGRRVHAQALPTISKSFNELQEGLEQHEKDIVIKVLKKVLDNIHKSQLIQPHT